MGKDVVGSIPLTEIDSIIDDTLPELEQLMNGASKKDMDAIDAEADGVSNENDMEKSAPDTE